MEISEIFGELEEIKQEIFRGKVKNFQIAEHPSRFKGAGFEIHTTNKWQLGEPMSNIDWNLSLRTWPKEIYKIDRVETRNAPAILVADISPSIFVEIDQQTSRFKLLLHLVGALGLAANYFHDPVGVLAVSQEIEFYLWPPKLGQGQILYAMQLLLEKAEELKKEKRFYGASGGLNKALEMLFGTLRRQCSVVVLSDFNHEINGELEVDFKVLESLSSLHQWNIIAIFLDDPQEFAWRYGQGVVKIKNIETGQVEKVKASQANKIREVFDEKREELRQKLTKAGVDSTVLSFGDHFNQLSQFLSERHSTR